MRVLLAAALLACLLVASTAQRSSEGPDLPDYDQVELQPEDWESQGEAEEEYDQEEDGGEGMAEEGESDDGGTQSRTGAIKETKKSSSSKSTSSSSKVTTTKVNVDTPAAVVQAPPAIEEVAAKPVENVAQKVIQPAVQKVVAQPVVQQVPVQPVIHNVVEKLPQPVVEKFHKVFHMPLVKTMIHKPIQTMIQQQHTLPQFTQKHLVQQLGVPQNHIDILPMSSGQYAVAVDDMRGSLVNYLSLDKQIHLVPKEMQGVNQYLLPAQDLVTHKQSLVHLGSPNGHLVLSDLNVGGQLLHGFQGWDDSGQVMVPVHGEGAHMMVEPIAHRINLGPSATSYFASPESSFSFVHA